MRWTSTTVRVLVVRGFTFLVLSVVFAANSRAQSSPPTNSSAPARSGSVKAEPTFAAIDHEQIIGYWTSETGWKSELQLRNNIVGQDLTVTPVLRLPDGAETPLAAVTIKPQEVQSIDLDSAISAANAPQLVGTWGSVVLLYHSIAYRNLYAALMIRSVGHPFAFHIDASVETEDYQSGGREGVWWLPTDTATDYLVVTNQGNATIPTTLSLYDANGRESKQNVSLGPHETTRYSIRRLLQAAQLTGSYGGIKISAPSHAGSIDTLHFIYDQSAAFSAILKMFDYYPNAKLSERDFAGTGIWTLRAPMLALSNPDPALAFPPGTTLNPQLFIRNTTSKAVDVAMRFAWRMASTTGKSAGPQLHLLPYETRRVNVAALQDGAVLPKQANWTSVTLTSNTLPNEIMAVAASYDATMRYGAQTPFSDQLTFQWEGGMWEYDAYHDSIITAGNGGTKPTQAAFTIFYNQGTQRYDLEQTLQPDEQMWIDIGQLIRAQVPDKNGKTLPADLTSGSYEIRDLTDQAIGALFEGKVIYDKTYGDVAYGCAYCCGYGTAPWMYYDPIGVPIQYTDGQDVWDINWCNSQRGSILFGISGSSWNTGNHGIATAASAKVTGVAVGSTTNLASGTFILSGAASHICPKGQVNPQGNANVNPTATIGLFSQNPILQGSTATVTVTVVGSGNISLAITNSGTGRATFDNQNGATTKIISGTTTVTIYGGTASSSNGDLTLTASYNGTTLESAAFDVSSGACTLSNESDIGSGTKTCPSTVTLQSSYTVSQYCPTCSYSCQVHTDGTWNPNSNCTSGVNSHIYGSLTGVETTAATGTFSASDCNWHYNYFITTVVNAQGVPTNYPGGSIGLKCTANGGTLCQ